MRKTRLFYLAVCLLTIALVVSGCGGEKTPAPGGSTTPKPGGTLKVGLSQVPKTLDPVKYTGTYESQVMINIFDTLVYYDKELSEIIPGLATSWKVSEDMKVYTFTLRDDVYFQKGKYQDGRKMTPEDIKYSLERSAKESVMKRLRMVEKVEVTGPNTVDVYLDQPNAAFLAVLTDAGNSIVPKEEVEGLGDMFGQNPVGTGAFAFKEWAKDSHVKAVRHEKYWGEKPYLDEVVWKFIPDVKMLATSLQTGDIDIADDITGPDVETLKQDSKIEVQSVPSLNVYFLGMDLTECPTKDIRVREAVNCALDMDTIVNTIFKWGGAERAYLPLPPNSWGYDKELENLAPKYDLEKAKSLMKEAGYENGFKSVVYAPNKPLRTQLATIVQTQLKEIGIDLEIKTVEWGTFSDAVSKGQAPFYCLAWTWYPDPDFFLYQMFHSKQIGSLGNGQGYNNPKVDELIEKAVSSTVDQNERKQYYKQAMELIVKDIPRVEAWHIEKTDGVRKIVHGYRVCPDGKIRIVAPGGINVWIEH